MDKLNILVALIVIFVFLILAILTSIVYNIIDLGVDIRYEIVKCVDILCEIRRINRNIYFKLNELQMKEEDDGK